jgi:hypothetical protein
MFGSVPEASPQEQVAALTIQLAWRSFQNRQAEKATNNRNSPTSSLPVQPPVQPPAQPQPAWMAVAARIRSMPTSGTTPAGAAVQPPPLQLAAQLTTTPPAASGRALFPWSPAVQIELLRQAQQQKRPGALVAARQD